MKRQLMITIMRNSKSNLEDTRYKNLKKNCLRVHM